jgi:hypothetical protein
MRGSDHYFAASSSANVAIGQSRRVHVISAPHHHNLQRFMIVQFNGIIGAWPDQKHHSVKGATALALALTANRKRAAPILWPKATRLGAYCLGGMASQTIPAPRTDRDSSSQPLNNPAVSTIVIIQITVLRIIDAFAIGPSANVYT